jgi:hypothetical protein
MRGGLVLVDAYYAEKTSYVRTKIIIIKVVGKENERENNNVLSMDLIGYVGLDM